MRARGTALVLIDVINHLSFPGADELVRQAEVVSERLARLKRRAVRAALVQMATVMKADTRPSALLRFT